MPSPVTIPVAHDHLAEPLVLGAPDVCGPLAVFPVFGGAPRLAYRSFAQALTAGAAVKELEGGASVNDLLVLNPTDRPVLLYEGEEVLGAQQNRTFDVSVLVAAGASLQVPVSCVEQGRWDHARHDEDFAPAPQAAYPELRRLKNRHARAAAAAGLEARASQGDVWAEVARKSAAFGVHSATDAMHDVFEAGRDRIGELREAVRLHDAQLGALATVNGRPLVLDLVSRSDVFAALHGPLVQGYALDALEAAAAATVLPPRAEAAQEFLDAALAARLSERDGIGMGREIRFGDGRVGGAGLVCDGELIQLTAFAEDGEDAPGAGSLRAHIRRPSRRRSA